MVGWSANATGRCRFGTLVLPAHGTRGGPCCGVTPDPSGDRPGPRQTRSPLPCPHHFPAAACIPAEHGLPFFNKALSRTACSGWQSATRRSRNYLPRQVGSTAARASLHTAAAGSPKQREKPPQAPVASQPPPHPPAPPAPRQHALHARSRRVLSCALLSVGLL